MCATRFLTATVRCINVTKQKNGRPQVAPTGAYRTALFVVGATCGRPFCSAVTFRFQDVEAPSPTAIPYSQYNPRRGRRPRRPVSLPLLLHAPHDVASFGLRQSKSPASPVAAPRAATPDAQNRPVRFFSSSPKSAPHKSQSKRLKVFAGSGEPQRLPKAISQGTDRRSVRFS